MKALVVGASGNIGSHLVETLITREHQVRALVRTQKKNWDDVQVIVGDVMDPATLEGAAESIDVVYHLVGYLFASRRSSIEPLNMAAARNVAEATLAAGVARLVFTSSSLVYGPGAERRPRPMTGHRLRSR